MRASTAFKRMLGIPGVRVLGHQVLPDRMLVFLELVARRPRCSKCGTPAKASYDRRRRRRWRHLDCFGRPTYLVADLRRLHCARCGKVRTEAVPFAAPGARHSRAFCNAVVWSVIYMDKAAVAKLWRIAWESVDAIVARAVDGPRAPSRLRAIGVDERSWGRRRALTVVVDHDSGAVIWAAPGTGGATLEEFFAWVGPEVCAGIELVSMDMDNAYVGAVRRSLPGARICFDPFHVVRAANEAVEKMRLVVSRQIGFDRRTSRRLRYVLVKSSRSLSPDERAALSTLARHRGELMAAWTLKEELADLYRAVPPEAASDYLSGWLARAQASGIPAIVRLARMVGSHFDGIVAAVEHGLSNSRLEGFNNKIALINRRGYGHRNLGAFLKTVYLCCGGAARPPSPWGTSAA